MKNFMEEAIKEALKAKKHGEVPIGAVIVKDDKIIAKAYNKRESKKNALYHAEILAINKACKKLKSWRLDDATIYVTLEPCPMCAGAISNARIKKLVYGASEKSSNQNFLESILSSTRLNHKTLYEKDEYHEQQCSQLLKDFFKSIRKK